MTSLGLWWFSVSIACQQVQGVFKAPISYFGVWRPPSLLPVWCGSKLHALPDVCHSKIAFHWTLGLFYSLWWFLGTLIWGNELWHYLSQSHCQVLLPERMKQVLRALTPMTPSKICSPAWGESATLSTLPALSTLCTSLIFYFSFSLCLCYFFTMKENVCRGIRQRRNGMSEKEN